jgi:hypothetical protein
MFIASGRAIDVILALMVLESVWLIRRRRAPARDILLGLAPGAALLLALRVALVGGPPLAIAGLLALSLPIHLADIARRRW